MEKPISLDQEPSMPINTDVRRSAHDERKGKGMNKRAWRLIVGPSVKKVKVFIGGCSVGRLHLLT